MHVNHGGCTAGHDKKRRLYVKHNEDGTVVAYCHHCGGRGFWVVDPYARARALLGKHDAATTAGDGVPARGTEGIGDGRDGVRIPPDTDYDGYQHWPTEAVEWLRSGGIEPIIAVDYGIGYSPKSRRLVLPVWSPCGLSGYQLRRLFDGDKVSAKYLTKGAKGMHAHFDQGQHAVVIVEDLLSAIRVQRLGYSSIALLTSTMGVAARDTIASYGYKKAVVWLDNDNNHVKLAALKNARMLQPYMETVLVTDQPDPKRLTDDKIVEVLNARAIASPYG